MTATTHADMDRSKRWAPVSLPGFCCLVFISVFGLIQYRLSITMKPQPLDAPAHMFSEARARVHAHKLASDIADRQVSMPGLAEATEYVLSQLHSIQEMVDGRADVEIKVAKETVSGAVGMTFTGINFTNAYRDLDVLSLTLIPKGTEKLKGVLVAAHHDSAVCSQGGSDDGAQSSVMIEAARTLLSRDMLPATPVTFLWTGGEEPISPAAHGWTQQSLLYKQQGAFINLEAMGGGGLPLIFQHTGSWVLEAYAKGCPLPRGSRVAQDVFDLQLIPADSDFRMFSAQHYGSLPGLDVAFVVGSTAYHTYLDTEENLKAGILQEMGENVLGGLMSVSDALAQRQLNRTVPLSDSELRQDARALSVYFDVLGYFMVMYPDDVAQRLHMIPLLILLAMPLFLCSAFHGTAKGTSMVRAAYTTLFTGALRAAASIVLCLAAPISLGILRTLISGKPMVWYAQHWCGHLQFLPLACVAGLLPWSGLKHRATYASPLSEWQYMVLQIQGSGVTASVVGILLTLGGMTGNAAIFSMTGAMAIAVSILLAVPHVTPVRLALVGVISAPVMAFGGSVVAIFLSVMMERMALSGAVNAYVGDIIAASLSGAGVLAMSCGVYLPLLGYGCHGRTHKLLMTSLVALSLGTAAWSATYQQPYSPVAPKRVILNHLHQTALKPLDTAQSSHSLLNHIHSQPSVEVDESNMLEVDVSRTDSAVQIDTAVSEVVLDQPLEMQVLSEAIAIDGVDSTPLDKVVNYSSFHLLPALGREHTPLYPLDSMLKGITVVPPHDSSVTCIDRQQRYGSQSGLKTSLGLAEATHAQPLVKHLPFIQLMRVQDVQIENGQQQAVKRLHFKMYSQLPCWGILNVTSSAMVGWSFTPSLSPSLACSMCGSARKHVVRFTTQSSDPYWPFWLDLRTDTPTSRAAGGDLSIPANKLVDTMVQQDTSVSGLKLGLRIELSVSYLYRTEVLRRVLAMLPEHVAETWLATVYQSYWEM